MSSKKDQIIAAIEKLHAAGTELTYKAIRDSLGGVGSNTTIRKALDAWGESKCTSTTSPMLASAVPAKVTGRLSDVATEIWNAGVAHAEQAWAAERAALLEKMAKVEIENEGLRTAVELKEIAEACSPSISPSQEHLQALEGALEHLTGVRAGLEEKIQKKDVLVARAAKEIRALREKQRLMQDALAHAQGELSRRAATER